MTIQIRQLDTADPDFDTQLTQLLSFNESEDEAVERTVASILADVKKRGDTAVLKYTNHFDQTLAKSVADLEISKKTCEDALNRLPLEQKTALEFAADRIRTYHEKQRIESGGSGYLYTESDGTVLGQKITPLDSVGIYVPGGKAAYPSSVLMNAIPAQVAGVEKIIMVVPTPKGIQNNMVLAAAALSGVTRVFAIGGAQAIGALTYGTQTIPAVDKIVGPGNAYVAVAKRCVFGTVGIDMIAGPSEILILCDGFTEPDWIAMDLFSQAEHDELAQCILVCPNGDYLKKVMASIKRLLPEMGREAIIRTSLSNRGAMIKVKDMEEACVIANKIAAEHLEISTQNPEKWLGMIRHAGAIFLGKYSSEALGDYCAGPNHVLPTSRTARFSSPLGVYDFQKRSSIIHVNQESAKVLGKMAATLAKSEGLDAHAKSAAYRLK